MTISYDKMAVSKAADTEGIAMRQRSYRFHITASVITLAATAAGIVPALAQPAGQAAESTDAITGVVNFITRKRFEGIEATGNAGFADGKQDLNLGFLAGAAWDTGSALFAYSFTRQGALANTARPWTYPDHSAIGPIAKNR